MNRHTIALAGAAAAVLISAAAMATAAGDAPTTIEACRNIRHGLVRIVFDANACKSNETHVSWDVAGPDGPGRARPAGRRRAPPARRAIPVRGSARSTGSPARACKTFDGAAGPRRGRLDRDRPDHAHVRDGRPPPPPPPTGSARLVINEVDYDQVGADTGGFVEIANTGTAAATLDGIALVLVNGGDGAEYGRKALTGTLAAGAKLVVDVDPQNGAPDGLALVDTASDDAARRAQLRGCDHTRPRSAPRCSTSSRARCCPSTSPTRTRSTGRSRGSPTARTRTTRRRTGSFTTTPTPGAANVKTP